MAQIDPKTVAYTPCPKKGSHQTFGNNFLKSQPIFKILSLLNRGWIFPTKLRNIFHHTLSIFLHCLGKFNNSNLLQILKKMQTRKFDFWSHLVLVHITYILIICFNFWFLLNILCKYVADYWRHDDEERGRSWTSPAHSTHVQSVPYGFCRHIEAGLHRPRLRRPGR